MAAILPNFPTFSVHENGVDIRWRKWKSRLDNLILGLGVKDKKRQRALLLHYAGEEVNEIFDTLEDTGDDYETALSKLTEYFNPKKNTEYEIYQFRQTKQGSDETLDEFNKRLRQLAATCEFTDVSKEIKSQIIQGCKSSALRCKGLREEMDLTTLLKHGRAHEIAEKQAADIEGQKKTEEINATSRNKMVKKQYRRRPEPRQRRFYTPVFRRDVL